MAATTTKTTFPYKNKQMSLIFIKHVISGDLYCCCGSLLDSDHKCKILKFVSKITVVSCDDDCKKCDVDEKNLIRDSMWTTDLDGYTICSSCHDKIDYDVICDCFEDVNINEKKKKN